MKSAAIKMRNYTKSMTATSADRRRILNALLAGFALLGLLYAYLLGATVWNIVGRRTLEHKAQALGNEVNDLELSYISELGRIDANYSKELGFTEVKPQFVSRNSPTTLRASASAAGRNEI